ncbi:MAG: 3-deoxy-manno-octulosonate cytidylyltransferase (CMP-KDO synthetase)e KdsB [Rhodobacteraceae bacterium HLUCCA12]|nr:MAG: 3-deoxy-manno-octulosonate cytidylyltransferase (CMP-KDO synthetase)e KdsB [Rhodobacteraceae bacterium HLUCCA12]
MSAATIIIPARYESARFPGKPLAPLRGAGGTVRSLLERTVIAARAAADSVTLSAIHVATDDLRIADEARRLGVEVIMTTPDCRNGTERVAQAVANAGITDEIIINLQGDAPLTPPGFVAALVAAMRADPGRQVATPVLRCTREALENFLADRRAGRVGATTVVCDLAGHALYFSKEVIPHTGGRVPRDGPVPVFHHVGLYAYRQPALRAYARTPATPLERAEGLEQLRFLETGQTIAAIEVESGGATFWELNNPSDVGLIEGYLARMGMD